MRNLVAMDPLEAKSRKRRRCDQEGAPPPGAAEGSDVAAVERTLSGSSLAQQAGRPHSSASCVAADGISMDGWR